MSGRLEVIEMPEITEPSTFRLNRKLLEELKSESRQKGTSLNSLVNQIIKAHIDWHARAASAGFIPIRRELIKELFEYLDEKEIDDLARRVVRHLTSTAMMVIIRKSNGGSAVELLERWIRISGLSYSLETEGDSRTYVIQHDMGRKWSYYLARLFEEVAFELKMDRPDIKIADGAFYIKLDHK